MKKFLILCLVVFTTKGIAQKKVLDHDVYDSWQSIKDIVYHPNGKYIVYSITPQEGDANLIIENTINHSRYELERGAQASFSEDGRFLVAKIKPKFAETRKAKIDKKKADEMPKDSLAIFELNNELVQLIEKVPSVKSFQLPEHGNGVLVYLKDKKGDISKDGTELVVKYLNKNIEKQLGRVAQYLVHPKGISIAFNQVKSKQDYAKVNLFSISDSAVKTLNSYYNSVTGFAWDEEGNQLAYLLEKDSTNKALQKEFVLVHYHQGKDSGEIVLQKNHSNFPAQYTFGGDRKLIFSKSGKVLELGIQPILPIKDTSLPEFERVSVDVWHYADPLLQPVQLKNLDNSLKSTETILYRPADNSVTYLGKIKERDIVRTAEGDGLYAYASIDSADIVASQWQGFSKKDLYVINTNDGSKKKIENKWNGNLLTTSYDGNILVYYNESTKKYVSYQSKIGQTKIIAKDILYPLFDEDNDVPAEPNAYGIAKWMDNDKQFLLYDRYDIWLVDATGILPSIQLTNGRKSKISYRFVETDTERKVLPLNAQILLKGFDEINKLELIATLQLDTKQLSIINQLPMHFTNIVAAKKSNNFAVLQEDEKESPNLYLYDFIHKKQVPKSITNINPQQAEYNWMTSQLVQWKSYTGKMAEGILYLPENFDPKQKYPMIVYFYERNNQTLHYYLPPAPTPSRLNIPFFVSRGYIVFVPDIWYKKGHPGQGAYDYIVSGTRAMVQKGFIDSTRLGLQGQSWGGYQIAHLITKTKLYAAAWAGAPVVNMTSAYGGIRWGTGLNRQFQYEKTQSRIGANLWERTDLYLKNSPLFELPKVTTPLVIMHNDADDAVPWYQGIEMFTAMRRLNKKVWMLNYNNEAHNLVERKNRKDIQIREQQFFDSFLKGAPMPGWLKNGVPAIMKGRDWGLK